MQDPLANLILEGKIADGDAVKVSAGRHGLVINGTEFVQAGETLGLLGGAEPPSHAVH